MSRKSPMSPKSLWSFMSLMSVVLLSQAVPAPAQDIPSPTPKRVKELQNLRFGMFICWSFSTFSGKEWTPGVTDVALFNPTGCDTEQWVKTAKEAGMGYILFLTKHHDGFCLWDTKTTDRKVTKSPLGRDVLRELRRNCDKHGIKLALYFSLGEFDDNRLYHPGGYTPEMQKAQLEELCTQYGPIEFYWMDCAQGNGGLDRKEITAWVKRFQPDCFVGFNGGGAGDLRAGEMGRPGKVPPPYLVGEFTYPILPSHEGGAMWFYSLPKHDSLCLPAENIYADYLGAVKYGNIFSLDAGPDYAGRIRDVDVRTLRKVGQYIRGELKLPPPPPPPLSRGKSARASSTWKSLPGFDAAKAFDGDPATRWGAAEESRSGWLQVDLGGKTRIRRAVIDEGSWDRVRRFELQVGEEGNWKTAAKGEKIGANLELKFGPVETRYVRLNILEANEVPTILSFDLYGE